MSFLSWSGIMDRLFRDRSKRKMEDKLATALEDFLECYTKDGKLFASKVIRKDNKWIITLENKR